MTAIAAVSKNWIIGDGKTNKMPWASHKEDLAFFKQQTLNKNLFFGRKTFEELPFLMSRNIFVLSSINIFEAKNEKGLFGVFVKNIPDYSDFIICGGATIYRQFLPKCQSLFLTEFTFDAVGDVAFPFSKDEIEVMFPNKTKIKDISNGVIWQYSK